MWLTKELLSDATMAVNSRGTKVLSYLQSFGNTRQFHCLAPLLYKRRQASIHELTLR